jgi:hypothetical protein
VTRAEQKVYNTLDYLSSKAQHQEIEIKLLKARLELQETHGKRQQTLFSELRSQTDTKAIFFSPAKVQMARDLLAKREQDKMEERIANWQRRIGEQRQSFRSSYS